MINLIPMPENIKEFSGAHSMDRKAVTLSFDSELECLRDITPRVLKITAAEPETEVDISFVYDKNVAKDSYSLSIGENGARVYASDYEGGFYALMSLRQLYFTDNEENEIVTAGCVDIKNDKPLYTWRGLQLDESRHFFGKETVKKLLDFMALYKLNRFHWHLTDDQGWRIEIKKYPLLTQTGSNRKGTQLHSWKSKEMDMTPYGGYYTQQDIKEIIDYAKERCIEIMPEIDFPAHSAAAIAAYNDLACREIPCEVFDFCGGNIPQGRGIKDWNRTLCLGKDKVIDFVFDVIDEVAELFPFEYFHIGGDEAPTGEWKKCEKCQARIKKEGLKDEVALQGWFTNSLNAHLKEKGKITVGWNEILKSSIDKDIVAQYWTPQRDRRVNDHLKKDGKVILSWHKYFYFDMLHSYCNTKDTYGFTYKKAKVPDSLSTGVLGIEGENWTEWTRTEDELFFKISVRGVALAEAAWCKEQTRDYGSFCERLRRHKPLMDCLGIYRGREDMVMKKAKFKKARLAKKNGIDPGDFDSEYRLDLIMKNR